jgi:ubiquinone/menaquinone biosynthesis C-methylase UbiE
MQQGRLLTKTMGGLLPEQRDLARFHRVLDVACGPGEWALDLAFAYPEIEVIGIDISQQMIDVAREQARIQGIENIQFHVMDATKPLDFPDSYFDLINARAIVAVIPRAVWPTFMQECVRILQPRGIIRLTECDTWGITNSLAFTQLEELVIQAGKKVGMGFSVDDHTYAITPMLKRLLQNAGCTNIQERAFFNNFSAGERSHQAMYRNAMAFFQLAQPGLIKRGIATQETLDQLYQQMLWEVQSADFCGITFFLTAWGETPQK